MNKIVLLGRLAADPEIKYAPNGTAVARFTLAVSRENDRDKADFFYCTAFGKLAQSLSDYCQKGRQVLLDGRVEINVVPDQQTNGKKTYVNVIVNSCEFLAKPQQQGELINSFNSQESNKQNQQPTNNRQQQYQQNMDSFKQNGQPY
ncbi:single-stranded DNA-binding protein (plasmid) [Psychrobacillus glaciei]|uniref:Single-stranded DNA-binding protein n=1 Tax=Psychrobacillus glaciei TaxID=2283160 RepID=A0A5J6STF1_9BACI|nr:single-stranded DNA-binding protein [Psychrobacillus glaciei]QFG01287.1 single-stranded DNA-binding protein [Psychrobacillus glaciei]